MPRRRRIGAGSSRTPRVSLHAAIARACVATSILLRAPAVVAAATVATAVLTLSPAVHAQEISDRLRIGGEQAYNWTEADGTQVVLVETNVSISTDDATFTADRAVIWLAPATAQNADKYTVQVALIGHAKLTQGDRTREGGELFVTATVRPDVQLNVVALTGENRSNDVHYLAASQLRRQVGTDTRASTGTTPPRPPATTGPASRPASTQASSDGSQAPVAVQFKQANMSRLDDGTVVLVLTGDVLLLQTRPNGDRLELQADSIVLFTRWTNVRELIEGDRLRELDPGRDLDAVYLEGDVRIALTPGQPARPEQTLRASRAVYEFGTDRAVMTDALLHSNDPRFEAPLVVRARAMRKLGADRYEANNAAITTSSFATPSIALAASKVSVRQTDTPDRREGMRTTFSAQNVTSRLYGVPVFYFPWLWGSMTDTGTPLRDIALSNSTGFGVGIETRWGLFQTLGITPPDDTDASYRLDYFSNRGPAIGLDANYKGGYVSENSLQPWSFNGNFTSYLVLDDGEDRLGRTRRRIEHDNDVRGRVRWEHQQFLTDNWQVQARIGYVSDGTFLEEWFRNEFRNGQPQDASVYLKRSQGSEVFTGLVSYDLSNVPTVADQLQEVRFDPTGSGRQIPLIVERLPEVQYHRIGDSFGGDNFTFVSNNSLGNLRFSQSDVALEVNNLSTDDLGFRNRPNRNGGVDERFAGLPSYGYTGYTDDYVVRGDFRQEIAQPMGDDRIRITPYAMVRYTAYSESPGGGAQDRILGGVGVRSSTQFHKVYDNVENELLDLHRLRHVIEPQVNLFASAQSTDRDELYIFDEGVDSVSDVAAAQFNVRQRFQTKRGGKGRWRSVDVLTTNTGVVLFANTPDEVTSPSPYDYFGPAESFRGTFYPSMPEASIPRSTAYADATWRVTDTTAVLGDVAWNLEHGSLATAAVGLAVQRDPRVQYFAGMRYIGEINQSIGTVSVDYTISERYSLALIQSFNFSEGQSQSTEMEITRRFEQFVFSVTVYFDRIEDEGGIAFSVSPRGLPFGLSVSEGTSGRR